MALNLATIDNLVLDMDGVLWRGETPMPGLAGFFATLAALQINFVLATNNATKVATQYTAKLERFGVDVPPEQILTSAEATASYLRQHYPAGSSVYAVGEEGLRMALRREEFTLLEADGFISPDARAELVVIGFNRDACWRDLASAVYLVNHGAHFVGTNPDATFPSEFGPLPGAGALLAAVETATGVRPEVIGKPGKAIFQEALRLLGGSPQTTAMVGDRLETDIIGARSAGLHTILLLSGVTNRERVEKDPIQPDLIYTDIEELAAALCAARKEERHGRAD